MNVQFVLWSSLALGQVFFSFVLGIGKSNCWVETDHICLQYMLVG